MTIYHELDLRKSMPHLYIMEGYDYDGDWMEWHDRANFLLFMHKAAMPGGGWNDLKAIVHCRESGIRVALSKSDHPYVVELVSIETHTADPLFRSVYNDIVSDYRKEHGYYLSSNEIINISKYEILIISQLRRKDTETIQDALG